MEADCFCEKMILEVKSTTLSLHCVFKKEQRYIRVSDINRVFQAAQGADEELKVTRTTKETTEYAENLKETWCQGQKRPFMGYDAWLMCLKKMQMKNSTYLLLAKLSFFQNPPEQAPVLGPSQITSPSSSPRLVESE